MKGVFGLIALLLSLAVVAFLVKKQITSTQPIVPSLQAPATHGAQGAASAPGQSPTQIQQQFKQALQDAMQQPRPVADEK